MHCMWILMIGRTCIDICIPDICIYWLGCNMQMSHNIYTTDWRMKCGLALSVLGLLGQIPTQLMLDNKNFVFFIVFLESFLSSFWGVAESVGRLGWPLPLGNVFIVRNQSVKCCFYVHFYKCISKMYRCRNKRKEMFLSEIQTNQRHLFLLDHFF